MGTVQLRAPFPWFGGKSRVAPLVWQRFGNVPNYVEPFAGSLAVLLGRPHEPGVETVNDADCMVSNFWRALAADPEGVAEAADWPVNEADLVARHRWLVRQQAFRERMQHDPDYYDVRIAGWWVWGQSAWIGSGWCERAADGEDGTRDVKQERPHLLQGRGVHRVSLGLDGLRAYMAALAARLRYVRVCCGDWTRILGPSPTEKVGLTGVFLDPPYGAEAGRDGNLYTTDDLAVAADVRRWAIAHGENPMLRIALCGYAGEHAMPEGWTCVAWKPHGGYGSQSTGRGRENVHRERIWFSPHCLRPDAQLSLFEV